MKVRTRRGGLLSFIGTVNGDNEVEKKFQGGGGQYCFDKHVERNDISFVFRALTIIACKGLKYNLPIDFKFHNCYEKCHLTKQILFI